MSKNEEFIRITRTLKTVFGILSIVGAPIAFVHGIIAGVALLHFGRMIWNIVMSALLLAGGITMLVGRSKVEKGGVAPIVLFAVALFFGLIGMWRYFMWFWILWAAGCLFGAIYSRVSMSKIARGEEVQFDPMGAARNWAGPAADAVRNAAGAAVNVAGAAVNVASDVVGAARDAYQQTRQEAAYQNWQAQADQQPQAYPSQAAQAAEQGYTPVFDVKPPKTMAQVQQEIFDRQAAEAAAREAAAAAQEMTAPASPFAAAQAPDEKPDSEQG